MSFKLFTRRLSGISRCMCCHCRQIACSQLIRENIFSFEENEMFVLHQTSARQRNWWQVVNERGNVGFVPSNYVEKLKVSVVQHQLGFRPRKVGAKIKSIIFPSLIERFRNCPNFLINACLSVGRTSFSFGVSRNID